ncbi:PIKK family atypical protein kinase [Trichomonas vaginalis G3]|uniref:non-specific serine/threonine protein kinase n=1 Tax=Trichomonas vaginalis (strain ATCC PRA-98 / G3) TaxID=412133 RepID=A2ESW1_TRIV3|nr:ataxia telangiectasia mutated (ATM) -related family [Trichomonas vaginalis G3]EAY04287.1 PIKK family atypical protein kinase [Trichomonas vaginalis G3]KAI5549380.1 ataxia telangiectasia mutated (ATM) -related family [Trichomonas vaginalis G3]|eukprot:XP_001316510.1 PIKK family atypical protein kinase [Trichomonas vaginalis G3]
MKSFSFNQLLSLFQEEQPPDFIVWKYRRERFCSVLGSSLIGYNESDLNIIFSNWENSIQSCINSNSISKQLTSLIAISVLTYFKRKYDTFAKYFSSMQQLAASHERCVCQAAIQIVCYAAEENSENRSFLRQMVDSAKNWLESPNKEKLIFNSLYILQEVGKSLPKDVFSVTTKFFFPEIWDAVCSTDCELRYSAIAVAEIHLQNMPHHSSDPFAEFHFKNCCNYLQKRTGPLIGPVLSCRTLLHVSPGVVNIPTMIEYLHLIIPTADLELAKECFDFLIEIASEPTNFSIQLTKKTIMLLRMAINRFPEESLFLKDISEFIMRLNMDQSLISSVVDSITLIVQDQNLLSLHEPAFDVLCSLLKKYPTYLVSVSLFQNAQICHGYIACLALQRAHLPAIKDTLTEQFAVLLTTKTANDSLICIEMISQFGSQLFDELDVVYEMTSHFAYSEDQTVRIAMAKTLPIFKLHEANELLHHLAIYDKSKEVRLAALNQLSKSDNFPQITQLLSDPSYKVRAAAVERVAAMVETMPFMIIPQIVDFLNNFIISNICYLKNTKRSAKASSLLPALAKYFTPYNLPSIPLIGWVCVHFLLNGHEFPDTIPTYIRSRKQSNVMAQIKASNAKVMDIREVMHKDFVNFSDANETENRTIIYYIENERWIESRAAYLFETLGVLSEQLQPYIFQIIPVFEICFKERHTDNVYITALKSLEKYVLTFNQKLKFLTLFPDLVTSLLLLLSNGDCSKNVCVLILKTVSLIGVVTSLKHQMTNENAVDHLTSFRQPSFFTQYVMDALVPFLKSPTPQLFEAVTTILARETRFAIKYVPVVIESFIRAISTDHDHQLNLLFGQIEVITMNCSSVMSKSLDKLLPVLKSHISHISCLRCCVTLSYEMKSEFTNASQVLYPLALHLMSSDDKDFIKIVLKFIIFTIIYQHTSVDLFLDKSQSIINLTPKSKRTEIILNNISMLVQQKNIEAYTSRIAQICLSLYSVDFSKSLQELLHNLILFGNLSYSVVEQSVAFSCLTLPHLKDTIEVLHDGKINFQTIDWIKNRKPVLSIDHLTKIMCSAKVSNHDVFKTYPSPFFNNTKKWMEDLCSHLVTHSPSVSIQCCSNIINQSESLRREIFPIAFLSCWKNATIPDRNAFSSVVQSIIQSYDQVEPLIFDLIEILDKCGFSFHIDDNVISRVSKSSALSLYFLQRYVRNHPEDKESVEDLLKLSSRMGFRDSARGILTVKSDVIGSEAGKWNEELGEWEKALEIYEKGGTEIDQLRCHAHLEQWNYIREREYLFQEMTEEQKNENAIWFAWAFYHSDNFEKVAQYVKYFNNFNHNHLLFQAIYLVASTQYDSAIKHISKCFELLTENREIYSGADSNQASKNLVFAQHLTELSEVIEVKKSGVQCVPSIWQQRLHSFSNDSDSWTKLIEVRGLLITPQEHMDACLKLISVLRKERKWRLIDAYFGRLFPNIFHQNIAIAYLKIMWTRGEKTQAISLIKSLNDIIQGNSSIEVPQRLQTVKDEILKSGVSTAFRARALRLQATWEYQVYKAQTASSDSLTDIIKTFKSSLSLFSGDYRAWSGWAYASSRALSHKPDERQLYATDAITAFLKATQLRPSESLEFLCQLFSILVRYGEDIVLPDDVKKELVSLPAATVHLIVPQIVVHIAHKDEKVRCLVQEIICNFADDHFEPVVYPLSVLSLLDDQSKSPTARSLLDKLGTKNQVLYKDLSVFIKGMQRCAISAVEHWLTALDCAIKYHKSGDTENVVKLIEREYENLSKPQCEQDKIVARAFTVQLQRVRGAFDRYKAGDITVSKAMWDGYRSIFTKLDEQMKHTEAIQLSKNSPELANRHGYSMSVPGTYSVDKTAPKLYSVGETLTVFATQQHPRTVEMTDETGKTWKFLLKGNEDLRLDQRIMQFFNLINSLLKSNRVTSKQGMSIAMYAVVPFAPNAGLISWVTGADTMQQLISDYRNMRDIPCGLENDIVNSISTNFNQLNALQKVEVYQAVCKGSSDGELRETLWLKSPTPSAWVERSYQFTVSTALMSMAGYVIGLGDRHPSNIMIQRHTGRVIHIDFGDSFEVTRQRPLFPELVPFRLTRMIISALDGGSVEGLFKRSCEDILYVMREQQSPLISQLEIFVHEPIFAGNSGRAQHNTLSRVATKLSGTDFIDADEVGVFMHTNEQVSMLIKAASDSTRYIRHFIGWCPFW